MNLRTSGIGISREPATEFDVFAVIALALQAVLALSLRSIAWTEVTTPGYLCSRGLVLYRDVKFIHTPGTIGILALCFWIFGASTALLRAFPLFFGLIAHGFLLRETRALSLVARLLGSALFLTIFYVWQGNSIWPTVMIASLAIPIAIALSREKISCAGILLGCCILFKQTAAYALFACAAALFLRRRPSSASRLILYGSIPYAAALLVFAALGGAREFIEWTLLVPFTVQKGVTDAPPAVPQLVTLATVFLPSIAATFAGDRRKRSPSDAWVLILAAGFALMTYPRFSFLNCLGAVPLFCLGAARCAEIVEKWWRIAARVAIAALALSNAVILAMGESFDGKVERWNEHPAFVRLVDLLKRDYSGYRLRADVWGNLHVATGMLPPGDLFVHWWEWYSMPVDRIGARIDAASNQPGTVIVSFGRRGRTGDKGFGPYSIRVIPKR